MLELNQAERQTTKRRRAARDSRKARKEKRKMLKRSSEILQDMQNEKRQLNSDIKYLLIFKKHFEEKGDKVVDKNTLHMNAGNVRGWVSFERRWIRLNAYTLNSEGYTDYSKADMRDCYVSIAENSFCYIPEGKKKEVLNAVAVNASIDEKIEEKRARIAAINATSESDVINALKQYNAIADQVAKLYNDNKMILDYAGIDSEMKSPHRATIDAEGYSPLNIREAAKRLDDDEQRITEENAGGFSNYINMKKSAVEILKSGGWRENNLVSLADQYGCMITGSVEFCRVYPLCVDSFGVMPSAVVSISGGRVIG